MRQLLTFIFILTCFLLIPFTAYGQIRLIVDGQELYELSTPVKVQDGRVLVPARDVFQRVGGEIGWHSGHQQVTIRYNGNVLVMTVGSREARLNGALIMMQVAPITVDGSTLIPLRFPAEAFGFDVSWSGTNQTATVNSTGGEAKNGSPLDDYINDINYEYEEDNSFIVFDPSYEDETEKSEPVWQGNNNELPPPGVIVNVPTNSANALARDVSTAEIQTIPHPETTITAIQTPRETGAQAYVVVASSPITEVNYFLLPDNRLVVDITNAISLISGNHYVDSSMPLSAVRASQFSNEPRVTRVVFEIVGAAEYNITLSADRRILTISFSNNRILGVFTQSDGFSDTLHIQGDVLPSIRISTEGFPQYITINIDNAIMIAQDGIIPNGIFARSFVTGQRYDGSAYINVYVGDYWPSFSIAHSTNAVTFMLHHGITGVRYDSVRRELHISRDFEMDITALMHIDEHLQSRYTIVLPPSAEVLGRGILGVFDGFINDISLNRYNDGNIHLTFNTARTLTFSVTTQGDYYIIRAELPRDVFPFIVVIDPGHGGSDPGAMHNGIIEKDFVLEVSHKVMHFLNNDPFIRAYMTREDDSFVSRLRRAEIANEIGADLFISIHVNAVNEHLHHVHGIETWYSISELEQMYDHPINSRQLAQIMQRNKIAQTGAHSRNLFVGNNIVVLRETSMPAVLLELGFITNVYESAIMNTTQYKWQLAQGIYNGIVEALGSHGR